MGKLISQIPELPSLLVGILAYILLLLVPFLWLGERPTLGLSDLLLVIYVAAFLLRPAWHIGLTAAFIVLLWILPLSDWTALLSGAFQFRVRPIANGIGILLLGLLSVVALRRRSALPIIPSIRNKSQDRS